MATETERLFLEMELVGIEQMLLHMWKCRSDKPVQVEKGGISHTGSPNEGPRPGTALSLFSNVNGLI